MWSSNSCFHTVSLRLPVYLDCFANIRSTPWLLLATFLKDPTETEEQRYLLLLCGLRARQFGWFLIGMGLTCHDSNTSLHKHGEIPENYLHESYLVSDLAARTFANCSSFLAQFRFSLGTLECQKNKVLYHDGVTQK